MKEDDAFMDDESRIQMLFPQMMFESIRERVGMLDSSALAELKSYKKPPACIRTLF
jgi:hypothetical protein